MEPTTSHFMAFHETTPAPSACTVYYDGDCPVCAREIALYRRLCASAPVPPAFENVSAEGCALPDGLTREKALARFHVRLASGELVSGAAAFIALWRATPRFRLIGRLASIPPLPWLLELAYRGFLKVRPLWRKP